MDSHRPHQGLQLHYTLIIFLSLILGTLLHFLISQIFWAQVSAQATDQPKATADEAPPTPAFAIYLPLIHAEPVATSTETEPQTIDWDPRLDLRGAILSPAQVTPGTAYWRLVEGRWFNVAEAEGRHHILVDTLDSDGQRQTGVALEITWSDGTAQIVTEAKPNETYAANFPMYSIAPAYAIQPVSEAPADRVEGLGLGEIDEPTLGYHTSYGFVWQWSIAGVSGNAGPTATATISVTPGLTATLTPTLTPWITLTLAPSATPSVTPPLTPAMTPAPTVTQPPASTPTPTATPTATALPTATPSATPALSTPISTPQSAYPYSAVIVGCTPDDRGSRFEGYTYMNGQLIDGQRIVFSYAPDGPWATQPTTSGNGRPGFYAHIISVGVARQGDWYAWLVDNNQQRISTLAAFTTDGEGGACNVVQVNFYGQQ
ncbi:MAG: hypothetical protein R3C14_39405 [Caldilineaceae bacterium]